MTRIAGDERHRVMRSMIPGDLGMKPCRWPTTTGLMTRQPVGLDPVTTILHEFCNQPAVGDFCPKHIRRCVSCGEPATHPCGVWGWPLGLVRCTLPLCDRCCGYTTTFHGEGCHRLRPEIGRRMRAGDL